MNDDISALLYEGAVAVREGRRDDARGLLMQVIERDENNELAWFWLSGAVDDAADQEIALENVLAINPDNAAARQGLNWLRSRAARPALSRPPAAPARAGEWVPPKPLGEDDVIELACWQCGASLYSVAQFCWQCHAPVHCCNNCTFRLESRCKELQGLTSTMAQSSLNKCPWWRPPE